MKELNLNADRILSILEPLRKQQVMWQMICISFVVLGMALFSQTPRSSNGMVVFVIGMLLIGVGFFAGYRSTAARKQYTNTYKKLVAEKVLQACFEDAHYSPEQGFSRDEFTMAGVFSMRGYDFSYHSEDLITGIHSGVEFQQSDVRVTHRSGGKNRRTVVDVDGRLTRFRYDKDIRGRILITSTNFSPVSGSLLYMFGNGRNGTEFIEKCMGNSLKAVSMEDVDFNQRFMTYATDAHSVYYLLTPPVMEYLKYLCSMDQKLSISFDGIFLYILRTGKGGIFEPPSQHTLDIAAEVDKSCRELQEIVYCIEALRLDEQQERKERLTEETSTKGMEPVKNKREEELYKELKEAGSRYEAEATQVIEDNDFEGIGWDKF